MIESEFILEGRLVNATSAPCGFSGWKELQAQFRAEDRKKLNAMEGAIKGSQVQDRLGGNLPPDRSLVQEDLNEAWREFKDDTQKSSNNGGK